MTGQIMGCGTEMAVLVQVVTKYAEKEGTSVIVGKYRQLVTLKGARIGDVTSNGRSGA